MDLPTLNMGSAPSMDSDRSAIPELPVKSELNSNQGIRENIDSKGKKSEKEPCDLNKKSRRPTNLSGFALVEYNCRKKKALYVRCQGSVHGSFLAGKENDEDCDDFFEAYKRCIFLGMQKDREKRGVGPASEGSALAEFEEEEKYE